MTNSNNDACDGIDHNVTKHMILLDNLLTWVAHIGTVVEGCHAVLLVQLITNSNNACNVTDHHLTKHMILLDNLLKWVAHTDRNSC